MKPSNELLPSIDDGLIMIDFIEKISAVVALEPAFVHSDYSTKRKGRILIQDNIEMVQCKGLCCMRIYDVQKKIVYLKK